MPMGEVKCSLRCYLSLGIAAKNRGQVFYGLTTQDMASQNPAGMILNEGPSETGWHCSYLTVECGKLAKRDD